MHPEQCTVVIPNWNGVRFLPTCLDSLRAQTYHGFEVLVVDSASTDGSVALVRRDYPEVKLLQLEENRGFAGAVNAGIANARGSLIALLNQDAEAEPNWLAELVRVAAAHPEAGAIASKIMLFDRRDHFHSAGDAYRLDGIPVNRGVWQKDLGQYDAETQVFGACGGAAAYRRSALDEVGWFDEAFFMYCEDVDLAWRLLLAGWRTIYAPRAIVYHHLSASGSGVHSSYYTGRNTIYVIAKNLPVELLLRYFPAIVRAQLRISSEAVGAWRGAAARARLRGQLAGVTGWPRMLGKRRAIQRMQHVSIPYIESVLQPVD